MVREITDYYRERYDIVDTDGVRVTLPGGWGLVRASNTQPILVLRFEAESPEALERIEGTVRTDLARFPSVSRPANIEDKPVLGKALVFLMAVASGATVTNLYYSQPLLEELSRFFHVSHPTIAFSAMLIQAGYGLGLLFLVPLGDVRERRSLIITMLLLSIGALLLTSFSEGIGLFLASSLFLASPP